VTSYELWSGVFPASLTMFNADGSLDLSGTAAHVRYLIDGGAHGVVIGGTSGEFITMTDSERIALVAEAVEAAAGRVPIVAGTGAAGTRQTIELTRAAADCGAAGALVILPYYMRPFRDEVMDHFRAVSAAATIPILLYNNPGNSGTDALDAVDIGVLYADGALQGVKSTFPTVHQVIEAIDETGPDFRAFYGGFTAPLSGLAEGAHGWISGVLNVALREALALWDAIQKDDLGAARTAARAIRQYRYLYSRQPLGQVNDLALYRQILTLRGQHGGFCRPPLRALDVDRIPELARLLATIGE
jgi:dihydrodipicolinate synthase/N-acetylneuraminate lyase